MLFPACEQAFSKIILAETGREMESKLTVSEYKLEEQNLAIIGGVFLRTSDGVIVCDNTLDSRVRLLF
jgi:vacuolar-type H+-ATPase subunit E/Vma4